MEAMSIENAKAIPEKSIANALINAESTNSFNTFAKQLYEKHGEKELYKTIGQLLGYKAEIPTIKEFLEEDEYIGASTKEGKGIYPYWKGVLNTVYPNPYTSKFSEVILSGSIGTGKTTIACIGATYDLYKVCMMKNPRQDFNLLKTTIIAFAIINATMTLAGDVTYDQMIAFMQDSKAFGRLLAESSGRTLLPNGIDIVIGSRAGHALGRAVFSAILDELNFQSKVLNQAYDNYTNLKRRMQSRFMQTGGKLPGRLWMVSSKKSATDFLELHIQESRRETDTVIYEPSIWEVKGPANPGLYSGEMFKVYVGDNNRDPFVIKAGSGKIIGLDEARIIDVPVELKRSFELDIHNSLRDLAGKSTTSSFRFIPSVEALQRCLVSTNPVYREIVELDFHDPNDKIINYVDVQALINNQFVGIPRQIHLDLAVKNDLVGIAATLVIGRGTVSRRDQLTGAVLDYTEPLYLTEFTMGVRAKANQEIPFYKIKEFIFDLIGLGYSVGTISTDGFQSVQMRQDFKMRGLVTDLISCDRTRDPYELLKDAIYEGRWMGPKHAILAEELKYLEDDGKKIDHISTKSKDISDAVAGSLFSCYKQLESLTTFMSHRQMVENAREYSSDLTTQWDSGGMGGFTLNNNGKIQTVL